MKSCSRWFIALTVKDQNAVCLLLNLSYCEVVDHNVVSSLITHLVSGKSVSRHVHEESLLLYPWWFV